MARRIRITLKEIEVEAELNDSAVAGAVWEALPFSSPINTWGEEIYFSIPVKVDIEHPQTVVQIGDLGYWPKGEAFCIFFGKTPASSGSEIKPASAVEVIGRLNQDPDQFKNISTHGTIIVEKIEEEKK